MYVCNAIGNVFDITKEHIDFSDSYQYPEPHKNGFEAFLWDTFGNRYDDIQVESQKVLFIKDGDVSNYLLIGQNLEYWIEKHELRHDVPPIAVHVADAHEYYKMLEMVDDLDKVFPLKSMDAIISVERMSNEV